MKRLRWCAIALFALTVSACGEVQNPVGKWRGGLVDEKQRGVWLLQLEEGGRFLIAEGPENVADWLEWGATGKDLGKIEKGWWWIEEPSFMENLKSLFQARMTRINVQFAPTSEDVEQGELREWFGWITEKDPQADGKTTMILTRNARTMSAPYLQFMRFVRVE
jgi:hypothetical protein